MPEVVRKNLAARLNAIPPSEQRVATRHADAAKASRDLEMEYERAVRAARNLVQRSTQAASELSAVDRRLDAWDAEHRELLSEWASGDLHGVRAELARNRAILTRLSEAITDLLLEADVLTARHELDSLESSLEKLESDRVEAASRHTETETAAGVLVKLASDSKALEISLVQASISKQLPGLQAVYRRLNPHPLFDTLDVAFGSFNERGEVYYRVSAAEGASGNASMLLAVLN